MNTITIEVTHNNTDYTLEIDGDAIVEIYSCGTWLGEGLWNGRQIDDCTADLGDELYGVLEGAILDAEV